MKRMAKPVFDICHLCGEHKKMSFEHHTLCEQCNSDTGTWYGGSSAVGLSSDATHYCRSRSTVAGVSIQSLSVESLEADRLHVLRAAL